MVLSSYYPILLGYKTSMIQCPRRWNKNMKMQEMRNKHVEQVLTLSPSISSTPYASSLIPQRYNTLNNPPSSHPFQFPFDHSLPSPSTPNQSCLYRHRPNLHPRNCFLAQEWQRYMYRTGGSGTKRLRSEEMVGGVHTRLGGGK